jgi:hypothetical protein
LLALEVPQLYQNTSFAAQRLPSAYQEFERFGGGFQDRSRTHRRLALGSETKNAKRAATICAQRETTGVFGHDPDNLHKQHRAELKEMASRYLACWK